MRQAKWSRHPGVRTDDELTFGERAADHLRNVMGSWLFVFSFLTVMCLWVLGNTVVLGDLLRHHPFDPYPYILLNLFLSMLAGLQGAILLIAAKRADAVQAEQSLHHLKITESVAAMLEQNNELTDAIKRDTDLLREIHRHLSVLSPDAGEFDDDEW